MRLFTLLVCSFLSSMALAQVSRVPVAATYTRLGAYSSTNANAFSMSANSASLANVASVSAGIYGERRFLVKELAFYNVALALPTNSGNFGVAATYFGEAQFNETTAALGYGRHLGKKVDVGAQFNYFGLRQGVYGNASALTFSAGLLVHLTDNVTAGVHSFNPVGMKLGNNEGETLPAQYSAGIGYDASEKFFVSAEVEKTEGAAAGVNAGMQYSFSQHLFARVGLSSANSSYYLGMGVQLGVLRLDATAGIHPQLGITPGIMLLYSGSKKILED